MTTTTTPVPPVGAATATVAVSRRLRQRRRDGFWAWLWYGVSAGLLAVILGVGIAAVALPRLTGSVPLTVLSASMEPALPPGTMLVVRPLAQDQLNQIRVGDVISYQPNPNDPTLVTHRVIGITSVADGSFIFTTKGDANAQPDPPVRSIQVRAVLWYSLPGLGWVNDTVNAHGNRAWIIPTAAGLLFAYAGYTVMSSAVTHRRKQKAAGSANDEEETDAAA
jgi:signal peptidase